MIDDDLRKLAEAATNGVWFDQDSVGGMFVDLQLKHYTGDAAFIAAASPDVVLGLLDEIAAVEAERDEAWEAVRRLAGALTDIAKGILRRASLT